MFGNEWCSHIRYQTISSGDFLSFDIPLKVSSYLTTIDMTKDMSCLDVIVGYSPI